MSGDSKYWQNRFKQMENAQHNTSMKQVAMIQEQFDRAQAEISGKIDAWYQRFAKNNGVSMTDARRMLSNKELKELKWNVDDYIKYGKENKMSGAWMKQLENASARVHISRLEALKLEVQQTAEKLFGNYADSVDRHMRNVYATDFYHTAYEIQKGIGVGGRLQALDNNVVSKIVSKPWAVDGKNFSERIWENKAKLINNAHNSLSRMCITGATPDKAITEIANTMKVSKSQAGRLVMTESAAFANKAREDCMNELGVEEFEIVETLDSITCEHCQSMDGRHFDMKDFQIGVTAPPYHPSCRGCTCPYFDDEFDIGERVARGADGKTYYVPAGTTYKEWKSALVDGDSMEDFTPVQSNLWERNRSGQRVVRKGETDSVVDNGIKYEIGTMNEKSQKKVKECYDELFAEYNSPLKIVKHGADGKGVKGDTDITGEVIRLNTSDYMTMAHEFFHSLANTVRDKAGLSDHSSFWKEIKAIRRDYNKAISQGTTKRISAYADESLDEFAAECFGQVKSIKKGYKMSWEMGTDTTYSQKVVDVIDKYFKKTSLENIMGSSTIKSLDIDDFKLMASTTDIHPEVYEVIGSALEKFENQGGMYIADIHLGDFVDEATGSTALFQVFSNAYGMTEMNINSRILGGKTLDEVNEMIAKTKSNLPQNLKEAVVHECGHAKAYYRKTIKEIEEMNVSIKEVHIPGISALALSDGAECIAETEVLLFRGQEVPKEAMELYEKYVKGNRK